MWIYFFYIDDPKFKTVDALCVDESACNRIKKDIEEGKKMLCFHPGEIVSISKRGESVITDSVYINLDNVYKIIIDDIN